MGERLKRAGGRYAVANRKDRNVPPDVKAELHGAVGEARISDYIEKTLAAFPPLTEEQKARVIALLNG